MAHPRFGDSAEREAAFLADNGVRLLVSLTVVAPVETPWVQVGLRQIHLAVADFTAPSLEQLETFVTEAGATIDAGHGVTVHCAAGLGRTGTFLAAWLIAHGDTAEAAIQAVRAARPGSIETASQEAILGQWEQAQGSSADR